MSTAAQVRQRVGEELALITVGGTLKSQDDTRITAAYNEQYERLKKEGIAVWASSADVPTQIVPYFSLMIEEKLLTAYSVPDSRYVRIKKDAGDNGVTAMAAISRLIQPDYITSGDAEDF